MSSKYSDGASSKSSPLRGRALLAKLMKKLFMDRGRKVFRKWFTDEEIILFKDNPDTSQLEPLFDRYERLMEESLEKFARDEGLESATAIVEALREVRDADGTPKIDPKKVYI